MRLQAKAFLFDMDGTLIDSSGVIEGIWRRWAERHHVDAGAVLAQAHGRRATETLRLFAPEGVDIDAEAAWLNRQASFETAGIAATVGAQPFLAALKPHEWAIVTSAERLLAERWLAAADLPYPGIIVTAEDVVRSKPDPEGYILAAQQLDCPIAETIIFEDAPAGLEAGRASGAKVVGIGASSHSAHLADGWIADFCQVQVQRGTAGDFTLILKPQSGGIGSG